MNQSSPLDNHRQEIETALAAGVSLRDLAQRLGVKHDILTSERSIRRALKRWGHTPSKAETRISGDEAVVTSRPSTTLNDPEALLRERGLDPEEWDIQSLTVNEWDSPTGETLKQLKLTCRRVRAQNLPKPARISLGKVFQNVYYPAYDEPDLVVFVGDQHAPHHDRELHRRFCAFLADNTPERGIVMGDLVDLAKDSRHPSEPDWDASTQECLDEGAQILLDYREASPLTKWCKLPGNHLERLRRKVINDMAGWYGLSPARVESLPDLRAFHDPVYLLRLDEIGVEYIQPRGSYDHASFQVTPYLQATHGNVAKKGSGNSALTTLDGLDHSVVIGHTHRQSIVQRTVRQIDGSGRLLQAAETGCMCSIEGGLGYAPKPDWSNGFATASVYSEGTFRIDLATYVDNHVYWRNERY